MIDALISCLIIAAAASLTSAYVQTHYSVHEEITETRKEMEAQWENFYAGIPACLCQEEEDSS